MHPLDKAIENLIKHHAALGGVAIWDGEVVVDHGDGTVDIKPSNPDLGPGLMSVPVYVYGGACQVASGAPCLFVFAGSPGDMTRPRVIAYGPGTTYLSITIGGATTQIGLAANSKPVVRVGDVLATGLTSATGGPVTGTIAIAPPLSTVKA